MTTQQFWKFMGMNPALACVGDTLLTCSTSQMFSVGDEIEIVGLAGFSRGTFKISGIQGSTLRLGKLPWYWLAWKWMRSTVGKVWPLRSP